MSQIDCVIGIRNLLSQELGYKGSVIMGRPFRAIAGSAVLFEYVTSGNTLTSLTFNLFQDGALVSSAAGTASGGGLYYAVVHVPSDTGLCKIAWDAVFGSDAYGAGAHWLNHDEIEVVLAGVV
jgi:hypothetical protein